MQVLPIAAEQGPQPSSHEIDQKLIALTKKIEEGLLAAGPEEPPRAEEPQRAEEPTRADRRQRLARVVMRLHSLQAAQGQTYDDEKWHLGPELDRLSDAIKATDNDPRWRAAYEHVRNAILLGGNSSELSACINELEELQ